MAPQIFVAELKGFETFSLLEIHVIEEALSFCSLFLFVHFIDTRN